MLKVTTQHSSTSPLISLSPPSSTKGSCTRVLHATAGCSTISKTAAQLQNFDRCAAAAVTRQDSDRSHLWHHEESQAVLCTESQTLQRETQIAQIRAAGIMYYIAGLQMMQQMRSNAAIGQGRGPELPQKPLDLLKNHR
jgi:hypothetical protein